MILSHSWNKMVREGFNLYTYRHGNHTFWCLHLNKKSRIGFFNPKFHPSGCYGVANARGPSLLPTGGIHHAVF